MEKEVAQSDQMMSWIVTPQPLSVGKILFQSIDFLWLGAFGLVRLINIGSDQIKLSHHVC